MNKVIIIFVAILLSSCSSYKKVDLGNQEHNTRESKVIIIPADFSIGLAGQITDALERRHDFKISMLTNMGLSENMYSSEHKQYIANEIAKTAGRALLNQGLKFCDKTVIVLTNNDINNSDFRFRYLFSSHFDRACLSVISTARINPANYGLPRNDKLVTERLIKLINKSIGLHHYKYSVSSNQNSVMYGPIMGPDDLDKIGSWY